MRAILRLIEEDGVLVVYGIPRRPHVKIAWPPSSVIAASKDVRVRVEVFWKSMRSA